MSPYHTDLLITGIVSIRKEQARIVQLGKEIAGKEIASIRSRKEKTSKVS